MPEILKIFQSRKFIYTLLALVAFMTLALTGTVIFSTSEVIGIIFGLLGIPVGGHVATDIAAIVRGLEDPEDTSIAPEEPEAPIVEPEEPEEATDGPDDPEDEPEEPEEPAIPRTRSIE